MNRQRLHFNIRRALLPSLAAEGWTITKMALHFGVGQSIIRKDFHKLGLPTPNQRPNRPTVQEPN
jgi:hypothetical protein